LVRGRGDSVTLQASHPKTLAHQTWVFPQDCYREAKVLEGRASIREEDGMILIDVADGRQLTVELSRRSTPSKTQEIEANR